MIRLGRFIAILLLCGLARHWQAAPPAQAQWDAALQLAADGKCAGALERLQASLEAAWERPSQVLVESGFRPLRNDPASRRTLREMLLIHAREAQITLTAPEEPGEPLRVSGVVRDRDNRPIAGAIVYVFQTNQHGLYSEDGMDETNPRIFGVMRTDAQGRYRFTTIRPGHYPDEREPVEQHIHYEVRADGYQTQGSRLMFDDDPFWRRHNRAPHPRAEHVMRADDGVCTCAHDVTLRSTSHPSTRPTR